MDIVEKKSCTEFVRTIKSILYSDNKAIYQNSTGARAEQNKIFSNNISHDLYSFTAEDSIKCIYPNKIHTYQATENSATWVANSTDVASIHIPIPCQCCPKQPESNDLDISGRIQKIFGICGCLPCNCVAGTAVAELPRPPRDPCKCLCTPCDCYDCARISDDVKNVGVHISDHLSMIKSYYSNIDKNPNDLTCMCDSCECVNCCNQCACADEPITAPKEPVLPRRRRYPDPSCTCKPCECIRCVAVPKAECKCQNVSDPTQCVMCHGLITTDHIDVNLCKWCKTMLPIDIKTICKCLTCECIESKKGMLCHCDSCQCIKVKNDDAKDKEECLCSPCECIICNGEKKLCKSCFESEGFNMPMGNEGESRKWFTASSCDMIAPVELVTGFEECSCSPCECAVCKNKPAVQKQTPNVLNIYNASVPSYKIGTINKSLIQHISFHDPLMYLDYKTLEAKWRCKVTQCNVWITNNESQLRILSNIVADENKNGHEEAKYYVNCAGEGTDVIDNYLHIPENDSEKQYYVGDTSSTTFESYDSISSGSDKNLLEYEKKSSKEIIMEGFVREQSTSRKTLEEPKETLQNNIDGADLKSAYGETHCYEILNKESLLNILKNIEDDIKFDAEFFGNVYLNKVRRRSIVHCHDCDKLKEKERENKYFESITSKTRYLDPIANGVNKKTSFNDKATKVKSILLASKKPLNTSTEAQSLTLASNKPFIPNLDKPSRLSNFQEYFEDFINKNIECPKHIETGNSWNSNNSDDKTSDGHNLMTMDYKDILKINTYNFDNTNKATRKVDSLHKNSINIYDTSGNISGLDQNGEFNNTYQSCKEGEFKDLLFTHFKQCYTNKHTNITESLSEARYYTEKISHIISKYKNNNNLKINNEKNVWCNSFKKHKECNKLSLHIQLQGNVSQDNLALDNTDDLDTARLAAIYGQTSHKAFEINAIKKLEPISIMGTKTESPTKPRKPTLIKKNVKQPRKLQEKASSPRSIQTKSRFHRKCEEMVQSEAAGLPAYRSNLRAKMIDELKELS